MDLSRLAQDGKGLTGLLPHKLPFGLFRRRHIGNVSGTGRLLHQGKWIDSAGIKGAVAGVVLKMPLAYE